MNGHNWQDDAACRDLGPDVMQPDHPTSRGLAIALAACADCPVRMQCELEAETHLPYGVWAGKWHGGEDVELIECEAGDCDRTVAKVGKARFCSTACAMRARRQAAARAMSA